MNIIDMFLKEDFLIVRPSIFLYVEKDKCNDLLNKGMSLSKDYVSCYLRRLPEESEQYRSFMENVMPVRLTLFKLGKIRDQKVYLKCVNISKTPKEILTPKDEGIITSLQKQYADYLNTCYKDMVPLENLPRIDLYLSNKFLPGFVCKVLKK